MVFNFYGASSLQYTVLSAQTVGFTKKRSVNLIDFSNRFRNCIYFTIHPLQKIAKKNKSSLYLNLIFLTPMVLIRNLFSLDCSITEELFVMFVRE